MENKLGITKGEFILEHDFIAISSKEFAIAKTFINHFIDEKQRLNNGKLISDSFNTSNKCGKLPSQLLQENEEMKAMILLLVDRLEENDFGQMSAVRRAKELLTKINQ